MMPLRFQSPNPSIRLFYFFLLQLNSLLTFQPPLLLFFHAIIKIWCSINRSLVTTSDLACRFSILVNSIPNSGNFVPFFHCFTVNFLFKSIILNHPVFDLSISCLISFSKIDFMFEIK
ncbi:hypothetical protein Hanom_Chr04g00373761 [Helianthus anomalus]